MSDDNYDIEEILFGALLLYAPPAILEGIIARIRIEVSDAAADAAEKIALTARGKYLTPTKFFEDVRANLPEELRPKMGTPITLRELLDALTAHRPEESEYLTPTPGCSCVRCEILIAKEKAGIKVRQDGTEVKAGDLN